MWKLESIYSGQLQEVSQYSRLVYARGLVSAAGGNISARCGEGLLITGSNVSLRAVDQNGVVLCTCDGVPLEGREGLRPSKETPFHSRVYARRPEINFIIHAHPVHATAFTLLGKELPMLTESARMKLVNVPMIPRGLPGSDALAETVAEAVVSHPRSRAFLMEGHGALLLGQNAEEAYCLLELLEDSCKIALLYASATR